MEILLLTGYLGSGKTTLLNRIINNRRGIRFAVIVNDIGEVNIDASLIQRGGIVDQQDDSLVALQNGCICCSLQMDLVEQISDIIAMQRFDYIVIEASGICEPGPIAQTICSIPQMDERYTEHGIPQLDCIASVVDALRLRDEFGGGLDLTSPTAAENDIENLVIQQIEFCNVVLLNKASEVSPEELERIHAIIRTLQPSARIIPCDYCDVDLDLLLHTGSFDFERTATSARWIQEIEHHHDEDDEHEHHHEEEEHEHHHHHEGEHEHHHHHEDEHEHHHHHHHGPDCHCLDCQHEHDHGHSHGIETFVYYRRQPLNLGAFDHFVARLWPRGIIRTKGICYFKGEEDMCYIFEQAGHQVQLKNAGQWYATMPAEELAQMRAKSPDLERDWDDTYGDRMQKLVFIGQHMDREAIITILDACLEA